VNFDRGWKINAGAAAVVLVIGVTVFIVGLFIPKQDQEWSRGIGIVLAVLAVAPARYACRFYARARRRTQRS